MGSPNEEQFDAITVKLQQVYDEWSAEACGQQTVREKIVSDFEEFVQKTKRCEGILYIWCRFVIWFVMLSLTYTQYNYSYNMVNL